MSRHSQLARGGCGSMGCLGVLFFMVVLGRGRDPDSVAYTPPSPVGTYTTHPFDTTAPFSYRYAHGTLNVRSGSGTKHGGGAVWY